MSTNVVVLTGRLTQDPELGKTQSGHPFCNFTIAVDRKYSNANGEVETDFIYCTAWRKLATLICDFCTKGKKIAVTGNLQQKKWTDRENVNRSTFVVVVEQVEFLSDVKRNDRDGGYVPNHTDPNEGQDYKAEDETFDDLPF